MSNERGGVGVERGANAAARGVQDVDFGRLHRAPGTDPLPGIVLIHDVWGPSEHSRALAARLAREGFAVLEIDLYRALPEPRVTDAGVRIRELDDTRVLADLDAAARWLAEQPVCRGRRIGVMGVCMGGTYCLLAACRPTRFSAAAPFYAVLSYDRGMLLGPDGSRDRARKPISPLEAAPGLGIPLLASFGLRDEFVPESDVDALEAGLSRSRAPARVDRYRDAGHAFLNETRPGAFRPDDAATALGRVAAFLHAHLD